MISAIGQASVLAQRILQKASQPFQLNKLEARQQQHMLTDVESACQENNETEDDEK